MVNRLSSFYFLKEFLYWYPLHLLAFYYIVAIYKHQELTYIIGGARTVDYEVSSHDLLVKMEEFQNHYRKLLSTILADHNVTQSAFTIMKTIKDEHKTLKELTIITALDKSTLSRQVNTLSKKGWIVKEAGADKRYAYLYLTEEALKLTNTLLFEIEQQLGFILRGWPIDEKQLLLVLLGRANRSMSHFEAQNKKESLRG